MIKLSNVLKNDHPLTRYEETIIDTLIFAALFAVGLIILIIYMLFAEGLQKTISVFSTINGVSLSLLVIFLLLIHQFLYGCRYIRRHNKAIQNGVRYQGIVIEKFVFSWGARHQSQYRFAVQLDNGKIVKTPIYTTIDVPFNGCDVYLYKRKYYFTEFSWIVSDGRNIRPYYIGIIENKRK